MNIVFLAGLFVATLLSQTCRGSMIPEHPQTAFCKADFGKFFVDSSASFIYLDLSLFGITIGHYYGFKSTSGSLVVVWFSEKEQIEEQQCYFRGLSDSECFFVHK